MIDFTKPTNENPILWIVKANLTKADQFLLLDHELRDQTWLAAAGAVLRLGGDRAFKLFIEQAIQDRLYDSTEQEVIDAICKSQR